MELFLDSADLCEIREALKKYPIAGVTTNPTILARTKAENPARLLKEIRAEVGKMLLFAQVTEDSTEGIIEEARALRELLGENTVIKIPCKSENLEAMKILSAEGIRVCATAVYTVPQALMAGMAGAEYAAPYVSHIDGLGYDGPETAIRMQQTLECQGLGTHVLGASFRVVSQVEKLMAGGADSATVTLEMLGKLSSSMGTDAELSSFDKNWKAAYGDKKIRDFI